VVEETWVEGEDEMNSWVIKDSTFQSILMFNLRS
jgi:hypothetical protein